MIKILKALFLQKNQLIKDIRKAPMRKFFKGVPTIDCNRSDCRICEQVCPTGAIKNGRIDLGKCNFCGECERVCPNSLIKFSNYNRLGATKREDLIVSTELSPIEVSEKIRKTFGRSLKLRQVSAGGCNACEMELNATSNANFDLGRYGIEFVASPRHADGIVITGPVTKNMAYALEETFLAMPEPKIIIAVGACAISGGVYANSEEIDRTFFERHKVDLFIPGCPAHPLTIINAILDFLGHK